MLGSSYPRICRRISSRRTPSKSSIEMELVSWWKQLFRKEEPQGKTWKWEFVGNTVGSRIVLSFAILLVWIMWAAVLIECRLLGWPLLRLRLSIRCRKGRITMLITTIPQNCDLYFIEYELLIVILFIKNFMKFGFGIKKELLNDVRWSGFEVLFNTKSYFFGFFTDIRVDVYFFAYWDDFLFSMVLFSIVVGQN